MMGQGKKSKLHDKSWEKSFISSWWLILFVLVGYVTYSHALKKKDCLIANVQSRLYELGVERKEQMNKKEDLLLQMNSQSDPAWIEMVLKKELGLVPDGQLKVHFTNTSKE